MTAFRSETVSAVVFDLDGTLYVNRDLGRAIHDAACRFMAGQLRVTPEEADLRIQEEKAKLFAETGFAAPLSRACARLGADIRELHRHFAAEVVPEPFLERDERVVELLSRLSQRLDLILYTNNNIELSGRIVRSLGLDGLFSRIYTIEDSWEPKPNAPFLDAIFADIGSSPSSCLFVGDRYDIDLRLPESRGAQVLLTATIEDLLSLRTLLEQPAKG